MERPRRSEPPGPNGHGGPSDPTAPSTRPRRVDLAVALFVTVTWAAVVFALDGLIAVALDRDPIGAGVSVYFGILALLLAAVLLWIVLISTVGSRTPWFGALGAVAGVYLVLVASALPVGLVLVGQQGLSPFVIAAALLAGLTVVLSWSLGKRWGPSARA